MKLQELATALEVELQGDPQVELKALAAIDRATAADLSFVVSGRYAAALRQSKAGAVIVPRSLKALAPGNALISDNPYASYARASWLLTPESEPAPGVHASAIVDPSARIATSASIGPNVVIGADTLIGDSVRIEANCHVGDACIIEAGCRLFPGVVLYQRVHLGSDCRLQSGAVIGSEGFGYARTAEGWQAIQQTGGVQIGERVHVGANTTIDCGAIDPTVIADGVILDNQIQIAHNVHIGQNTAIAGCTGIAGSTQIGRDCQIGGACNIVGHIRIADEVIINAASLVSRSIDSPGRYGSGMPLQPEQAWRRSFVTLGKIDQLMRRVRRLERLEDSD